MLLEKRFLAIMFCCLLLLVACTQKNMPAPNQVESSSPIKVSPVDSSMYPFVEIVGFLEKNAVLLNRQNGNIYELVRRELESGAETVILQTVNPIILSSISPDGKKIIFQEAYDEIHSLIQVVDTQGSMLWEDIVEGTEIQWYFNPFRASDIYIQSFGSDWSYKTNRLNLETNILETVDLDQTFFQWDSADEIVYLDWDADSFAPTTNLVRHNIVTDVIEIIEENCYAFTIVEGVWTIFQVIEEEGKQKMSIRSIMQAENKEIFSYEAPLKESFSENLQVSNFSYAPNVEGLLFYGQVGDTPKLLLGKSNETLDMKQPFQGALPIIPQLDGKYVLVGYQNEWLLHVETMTWQSMYA